MAIYNSLILYKPEQKAFEKYPKYNKYQRRDLFVVTKRLKASIIKFRGESRVRLFTKYVYFKTHFKIYDKCAAKDLERARAVLDVSKYSDVDERTKRKIDTEILKIFGFRRLTDKNEDTFIFIIHSLIRKKKSNKEIFDILLESFPKHKVAIPEYRKIEDLIHKAYRLFNPYDIISKLKMSRVQKNTLSELLEEQIAVEDKNSPNLVYKISKLKHILQSKKLKDIKSSIVLYKDLKRYYLIFENYIDLLGLDPEGLKKTALEFKKMDLAKVRRLPVEKRNVLLLSFIKDQYFKQTDYFVEIIIDTIQSLQRKAKHQQKEQVSKNQTEKNRAFKEVVEKASKDNSLIMIIKEICSDTRIDNDTKIEKIKDTLKGNTRGRKQNVEKLDKVLENIENEEYLYTTLLLENFRGVKSKVKPILEALEFDPESPKGRSLLRSLNHIHIDGYINIKEDSFLSEADKFKVTFSEDKNKTYLVYLYLSVASAIKSGQLNLKHSYKYRSLEDYLIPRKEWEENKDKILSKTGLFKFKDFDKLMKDLERELEDRYNLTNNNIRTGMNTEFNSKADGKFTVTTPATDYSTENLLYPYFPRDEFVPLAEILKTVNKVTGCFKDLEHIKRTHLKGRPDVEYFIAGIIALGCNISEHKMAKISKRLNQNTLKSTMTWYFTKDGLSNASDTITNHTNTLTLPKLLQNDKKLLHTSSDGARWVVNRENIYSRHALKYFGLNKGININSHIDERHIPFYSKVISTSEREAASVLDGLLHNDNVRSDIHSTDTHGYTEALFGVMNMLGFKFAPRIKSLKNQRLYSFKQVKEHKIKRNIVLPHRKLNLGIVRNNFDEILRIVATIGSKRTEASQIFKRLNSYSNENPTYKGLKEFGKIYKTIFILEYIDDVHLRQKIEKLLNKVEESQRFSRAICFANNQELIGRDKEEIEIGELARRLIKSAIIYWNYLYLTKKIVREKSKQKRARILWSVSKSSILHWQHLNFLGEYDFSERKIKDKAGLRGKGLVKSNVLKMWKESQEYLH